MDSPVRAGGDGVDTPITGAAPADSVLIRDLSAIETLLTAGASDVALESAYAQLVLDGVIF